MKYGSAGFLLAVVVAMLLLLIVWDALKTAGDM